MRIAVTGNRGKLGSELVRRGCIPLDVDITNQEALSREVKNINPDVIINCAAYTNVNECESDTGYVEALKVNYFGVKNIRTVFPKLLIHISTDYVFDGKRGPYSENAKLTLPVNSYGLTKQSAEILLHAFSLPFSIVRTTCLYEIYQRKDFVASVLNSISVGKEFEATKNLSGNPTYIPHLAEALLRLINLTKIPKVIHLSGREAITRYEFALMIANVFGYDKDLIVLSNKKFWVGDRPKRGGFKTTLAEKLGLPIYSVIEGLKQYKEDLAKMGSTDGRKWSD
jgi:dTDP-4-dehydrorhamnose reductase